MTAECTVNVDLAKVFDSPEKGKFIRTMAWGDSVEVLNLTVNGEEDAQLDSAEPMFGNRPSPTLTKIADFKVAPVQGNPDRITGVLSGGRFKPTDKIYVNGVLALPVPNTCREDLCIVTFDRQSTDFLTVTISPDDAKDKAVSRTVVNPTSLRIISASVVSYQPGDTTHPAVLTVKLDGSGFKENLEVRIVKADGPPQTPQMMVPSAGQMILKIVSPRIRGANYRQGPREQQSS